MPTCRRAGTVIVKAITQNAGQTCSAGSRVVIEDKIYDSFVADLAKRFKDLRVGSGEQDLDLGPVVNAKQCERVQGYIDLARRDGLTILAEGELGTNVPGDGYYVRPTPDRRRAARPPPGPGRDLRAGPGGDPGARRGRGLKVANGTEYGLAAGIWTQDLGKALRLSKGIKSGQVFVNNYGAGGGVELPFGGVKGFGPRPREGLRGPLRLRLDEDDRDQARGLTVMAAGSGRVRPARRPDRGGARAGGGGTLLLLAPGRRGRPRHQDRAAGRRAISPAATMRR